MVGLVALAIAMAVFAIGVWQGGQTPVTGSVSDAPVSQELLLEGQNLYQTTCAVCHGSEGGGFATAGIPAPPLDGSAHSWHHPDGQIIGWIRNGGVQMPAVGADWSAEEVRAVMAYFKQWWEPWQQEAQSGDVGERILKAQ